MRNGTHFEKSIECHGIFIGPCFWQAFCSANTPSFTAQLPELVHDLCPFLLLAITSKVADYVLILLECSGVMDLVLDHQTPWHLVNCGAVLVGGIIQGLCFKGSSTLHRNCRVIDSQCWKLSLSAFGFFIL